MSATPRFSTADIARRAERTDLVGPVTPEPAAADADARVRAEEAHPTEVIEARPIEAGRMEIEPDAPLFTPDASDGFQHRWDNIQAGFVDDPRHAVEEADALVAETMQRLAENFAQQREGLEKQLSTGSGQASTEDLRIALRHYRSFFKRLLSV